jgi:hypothetical protein
MNNNGLLSSSETHPGLPTTKAFYLTANDEDVVITGDLAVGGSITMTNADISNSANIINYSVGGTIYPLFPSFVKITTAGTITKQTSATLVAESAFTIPMDGYYSFTAQISLGGVGTVADGENFQLYLDVSGGSLTPINGTINILDMTENTANSFSQTPTGIIMQKLTAGQVIQLYHLEQGSYTFSSGSIQVAYAYLGNDAL